MSFFDSVSPKITPPPAAPKPSNYNTMVSNKPVTSLQTTNAAGQKVAVPIKRVSGGEKQTSVRYVSNPTTARKVQALSTAISPSSIKAALTSDPGALLRDALLSGRRAFDHYGDFGFAIDIEGIGVGSFMKFDGISLSIDEIEYSDSLDPHNRKRPGKPSYGNIKLTKGVIANDKLWQWCMRLAAGEVDRRNGSIFVLMESRNPLVPVITYHFMQAWPSKWTGLRLDGKGTATLVEEIELVVDHVWKK